MNGSEREGVCEEVVFYICKLFVFHGDDSSHQIMVARKVLGPRVVLNVSPEVQSLLQVRRHHGVVHNNDRWKNE